MSSHPSLSALRAFAVAGRTLSFTRAAEVLHVTQAAVSHQIRVLEGQLGTPLFQRTTRTLALTPAGKKLLPALVTAFDGIEQAVADVRNTRTQLSVTTRSSFGAHWLAPRLPRFAELHPDIEVSVRHTDAVLDLVAEDIDVAIRVGLGSWPGLTAEPLGLALSVPVAAPAYAQRVGIREPADLAGVVLLHDTDRSDWQEWLTSAGLDPALAGRGPIFDDGNVRMEAILSGHGVGILAWSLAATLVDAGRLQILFDQKITLNWGYYLVYPPNSRGTPKIAAFRSFVLSEARGARRSG